MPKALIDAELLVFKAMSACEYYTCWDEENHPDIWTYDCDHAEARSKLKESLIEIKELLPSHMLLMCYGDRRSFRYTVYKQYKANRLKKARTLPAGHPEFKKRAIADHPSVTLTGVEGDDVLGILHCEGDVIVSQDKDLLTIPGLHLRDGELIEQTQYAANHAFFTQCLKGDAADNYPGLKGMGAVGAKKLLSSCKTEYEMWHKVLGAYEKAGHDEAFALQMARCARILRQGEYDLETNTPKLWTPPLN